MKKILFFLALGLLSQNAISQQAWTRSKGSFYTQIGFTPDNYDGFIPNNGGKTLVINRKVQKHTADAYIEYGITNKLMVTSSIPFILAKSKWTNVAQLAEIPDGSLNGFSNIEVGLTYNLLNKNGFVLSGKLNTALPTATIKETVGLRTGNDAMSFEPSLLVGYGHSKFFASADIGFGFRSNNYSNQSLLNAQIGKFFGKKKRLLLILNAVNRVSQKNGSY
jgi:hypothetical protein